MSVAERDVVLLILIYSVHALHSLGGAGHITLLLFLCMLYIHWVVQDIEHYYCFCACSAFIGWCRRTR